MPLQNHTVTLARKCRIPTAFGLSHETRNGEPVTFLVRLLDQRRALVKWTEGEATYTPQQLSQMMLEEADYDDPRLKAFL